MRNTLPLLSRTPVQPTGTRSPSPLSIATPPNRNFAIPTIRLTTATPSAKGNTTLDTTPSPLAPKSNGSPRKRLIPKKSKLGLLGGRSNKENNMGSLKELPEVPRPKPSSIGSNSTGRNFDIYVDPTNDPDIGEIVVVKKKKSRAALKQVQWGPLGDVTNAVPAPKSSKGEKAPGATLKAKSEGKEKWWSIGRGRKDSKEKTKEKAKAKEVAQEKPKRSASPGPMQSINPFKRQNSFDSGILLNNSPPQPPADAEPAPSRPSRSSTPALFGSRPGTPSSAQLLAPPTSFNDKSNTGTDSIAVRAMKSMKSLARIGSWAQLRNSSEESVKDPNVHDQKKTKATKSVRSSVGSSFEAGGLTPIRTTYSYLRKGSSGTTGTMGSIGTLGTVSSYSTQVTTSSGLPPSRRVSTTSTSSHYIPSRAPSIIARDSPTTRQPKRSSGASSVRWDDHVQVKTITKEPVVQENRRGDVKEDKKGSRRSSESRRRPALSALFPDTASMQPPLEETSEPVVTTPTFNLEQASPDRGGEPATVDIPSSPDSSVSKKPRARPMSEQLLGRSRPQAIVGDDNGVISILDAATADLANLINRLDLQATPDATPRRQTPRGGSSPSGRHANESPIKKAKQIDSLASIESLRAYSKRKTDSPRTIMAAAASAKQPTLGQQIAPWPMFDELLASFEAKTNGMQSARDSQESDEGVPTFRFTHKRTLSPPAPAPDPPLVLQPLKPAKAKGSNEQQRVFLRAPSPPRENVDADVTPPINESAHAPSSSMTFGVPPLKIAPSRAMQGPLSGRTPRGSKASVGPSSSDSCGEAIADKSVLNGKARRELRMAGTMGSVGNITIDPEDPDSDIPDELQVILSSNRASMVSTIDDLTELRPAISRPRLLDEDRLPRPVSTASSIAPELPSVPVFRATLIDDEDNEADIDEGTTSESSEEDTKEKTFDFTGELRLLNESGASDRRSFVEQLDKAFKTPARINIGTLGENLGLARPFLLPKSSPRGVPENVTDMTTTDFSSSLGGSLPDGHSNLVDVDVDMTQLVDSAFDMSNISSPSQILPLRSVPSRPQVRSAKSSKSSTASKASDGKLNRDFKFGAKPPSQPELSKMTEEVPPVPLTLSDIIPPPSHTQMQHARDDSMSSLSMVEEDSSLLKSIYARASDIPETIRVRLDSDSSSKRRARSEALMSLTQNANHARNTSEASTALSFEGFSSFEEVRRGIEFGPNRPAFYPPSAYANNSNASSKGHARDQSLFSIASVSSYGVVLNSGSADPFDYGRSGRPLSEDLSMSVDDTFSFLRQDYRRTRVDSDASSFYFNHSSIGASVIGRAHRNRDSVASVTSGPPISLYNRSYGAHRRNDSSTSGSSIAHAYGTYGAGGGRAAWARHRRDMSMDSSRSDFSAQRLGRPGLGDKMLESAHDYGMPLTAISASPTQSLSEKQPGDRTSYDSIMDGDVRSVEDSLFERTDNRTSVSSESVFGIDENYPVQRHGGLVPPVHFRPVSVYSVTSHHSSSREDDTMISMLGGGHVRRRSVTSAIEASPCIRVEKTKFDSLAHHYRGIPPPPPLPKEFARAKPELSQRNSVASTSSYHFGAERMDRVHRGLLERQSLEDSCLSGEGEDISNSGHAVQVFRRPDAVTRARPVSDALSSSGADTPPLCMSDVSSQSSGSQSSIDLALLNVALANATQYVSGNRVRNRARGQGHRRRISQAHASRSSVYETIQEEVPSLSNSPTHSRNSSEEADEVEVLEPEARTTKKDLSAVVDEQVSLHYQTQESNMTVMIWDDDETGPALRKYYALENEAQETLVESKRTWEDTAFSLFALQAFDPPRQPHEMRALLEHSQKTYGPLPPDLHPYRRRSRTFSRPSPYPRSRKTSATQRPSQLSNELSSIPNISLGQFEPLQNISVNPNVSGTVFSPPPVLNPVKAHSPFIFDFKDRAHQKDIVQENTNMGLPPPNPRPRVASGARRSALGWTKRSTGKSSAENKENTAQGTLTTPNQSLRIVRPRPRGRPTPRQAIRA